MVVYSKTITVLMGLALLMLVAGWQILRTRGLKEKTGAVPSAE